MSRGGGPGEDGDREESGELRVGVDIGGTFTDFVLVEPDGRLRTHKVLSTPGDPSEAVLRGLEELLREAPAAPSEAGSDGATLRVVHGSTVATNALLERRGARVAFVTSAGFGDLLHLGRQARPELYDLHPRPPEPLVPPERCHELDERVDRRGRVLRELDDDAVESLVARLEDQEVESVAVCFLFSFLDPEHERRVAGRLRERGFRVSTSSRILPEFREFERASTTVANAYVTPDLDRYLGRLRDEMPAAARLRVMQSSGGSVGVETARAEGIRSVLSGPAGGVVGAVHVAGSSGTERALTFDMGGTSTDVSVAEGGPAITREAEVAGVPVAVPVVDLHTVGSGGGSVARVDRGGALRVGPDSAGARPGPACYGRGGDAPTVTDANLVLGRLDPDRFLGGALPLDVEAADRVLEELAARLNLEARHGLSPARRAALGVIRVSNAHMERALRVISVERGHDPADFTLVSFGGAGGLHAADLARRLGVPRLLVPPAASVLSALGMLTTDVVKDYGRTVMLPGDVASDRIAAAFEPLLERAREEMREEGVPDARAVLHRRLDLRYEGQSYEITVPFERDADPVDRFHAEHASTYGHADRSAPVEVVNVRVRAVGRVDPPPLRRGEVGDPDPAEARIGRRTVVLPPRSRADGASGSGEGAAVEERIPFYDGEALEPGHRLRGPAVVLRPDTTVFVGRGDRVEVDRRFNLAVEVGR